MARHTNIKGRSDGRNRTRLLDSIARRQVTRRTVPPTDSIPTQEGEIVPAPPQGLITVGPIPEPSQTLVMAAAIMSDVTTPEWVDELRTRFAPAVRAFASAKEVGLSLLLLGVAEAQEKRLGTLIGAVQALEEKVFSPEMLTGLTPAQLFSLYEFAASMLDQSTRLVSSVYQVVDFDKIRTTVEGLLRGARIAVPPIQPPSLSGKAPEGTAPTPVLSGHLAAQILHLLNTKAATEHCASAGITELQKRHLG